MTDEAAWAALEARVTGNPQNAGVWALLRGFGARDAGAPPRLYAVPDGAPLFEGEAWLFAKLGAALPAASRARVAAGAVLLAPRSGLVLALHVGRCTFFVRDDEGSHGPSALLGDSLDAVTDARALGAPWRYAWSDDCEDDAALLARALARAEATAA